MTNESFQLFRGARVKIVLELTDLTNFYLKQYN
jgi:hypothetical protein